MANYNIYSSNNGQGQSNSSRDLSLLTQLAQLVRQDQETKMRYEVANDEAVAGLAGSLGSIELYANGEDGSTMYTSLVDSLKNDIEDFKNDAYSSNVSSPSTVRRLSQKKAGIAQKLNRANAALKMFDTYQNWETEELRQGIFQPHRITLDDVYSGKTRQAGISSKDLREQFKSQLDFMKTYADPELQEVFAGGTDPFTGKQYFDIMSINYFRDAMLQGIQNGKTPIETLQSMAANQYETADKRTKADSLARYFIKQKDMIKQEIVDRYGYFDKAGEAMFERAALQGTMDALTSQPSLQQNPEIEGIYKKEQMRLSQAASHGGSGGRGSRGRSSGGSGVVITPTGSTPASGNTDDLSTLSFGDGSSNPAKKQTQETLDQIALQPNNAWQVPGVRNHLRKLKNGTYRISSGTITVGQKKTQSQVYEDAIVNNGNVTYQYTTTGGSTTIGPVARRVQNYVPDNKVLEAQNLNKRNTQSTNKNPNL